jgi:hypothetical protein
MTVSVLVIDAARETTLAADVRRVELTVETGTWRRGMPDGALLVSGSDAIHVATRALLLLPASD